MRFVTTMTAAAIAAAAMALPGAADASVVVSIAEVGINVVATTTGSLNLAALTVDGAGYGIPRGVRPSIGLVSISATDGFAALGYYGFTGPAAFGSGSYKDADSGTGASFALYSSFFVTMPEVFVAPDYTSGSSLAGSSTFLNATIVSLGFTTGTYIYRAGAQTVTVIVGPSQAAVPEPVIWAMMIVGFGAVGFAMRRRRTVSAALSFG